MGDFTHFDEKGNAIMVDVSSSRTIQPKREMSLVWRGLPELWRQKRMPN